MKQLRSPSFFKTLSLKKNTLGRNSLGPPKARLPGAGLEHYSEFLRKNWQKFALLGLLGLGLFLGARTAAGASSGWQEQLVALLRAQRLHRMDNNMISNAIAYFGGDLLFLAAAYLLGLCAAGLPLLLLLPVLRGLGLGVVSGWLYMSHGAAGVGYSVLVLYPATVISILIMLAACKESMLMSSDMLLMLGGKLERAESSLRLYTTRYFVLLLSSAAAAAMDALCFAAFSGVFEL